MASAASHRRAILAIVIVVEPQGRLGNHLFQWAFAYAAGRRLDVAFTMDESLLRTVFDLGPEPTEPRAPGLRERLRRRARPMRPRTVDNTEAPGDVLASLRDRTHYFGFFQSAQYFAGFEPDLRARLTLRPEHVAEYAAIHGGLEGHIAVHVRRGDYRQWRGGAQVPIGWYEDCLKRIQGRETREVVVVSDELDEVRDEFADTTGMRFVSASQSVDLQVLLHADAIVASPSSFSWWGAWLNRRSPQVFVPQRWLGDDQEWPVGVVCPGWTELPIGSPDTSAIG